MMTLKTCALFCLTLVIGLSGCVAPERSAEKYGKTFYLDGAGNWGFGASSVPSGLRSAGYRGDVEIYVWTTSLNPLIDQLNIFAAKFRAAALTKRIQDYCARYPRNDLNIIALSAGTGVAVWAVEGLNGDAKVHNLILLGSSLSHNYDVTRTLEHMSGKIYVYHSPHDLILGGVKVIGTIDGKRGVEAVGQIGLDVPLGMDDRVVNIAWRPAYMRFGWTGAHTDCTTQAFVERVIAKHVVSTQNAIAQAPDAAPPHADLDPAAPPPAAHP